MGGMEIMIILKIGLQLATNFQHHELVCVYLQHVTSNKLEINKRETKILQCKKVSNV